MKVGEPLARGSLSLGVRWDLSRPETRGRLTWLLLKVLRPKLLYITGVGPWGVSDFAPVAQLLGDLLEHQDACGLVGVLELSRGSALYKSGRWSERFSAKAGWSETTTTMCMWRAVAAHSPVRRATVLLHNTGPILGRLGLCCRDGVASPLLQQALPKQCLPQLQMLKQVHWTLQDGNRISTASF